MRDLFNIKVDIVFYDVTSIYFERREPKEVLRKHGYSRDGKPRNVQVVLGMVMVGGFPIASHVFRGNKTDKSTMIEVVRDVDERFGLKDVIFVADKAMVSPDNREFLESLQNWYYLLGHPGRKNERAKRWLTKLSDRWIECPRGSKVQEVDSEEEGIRVFIVESNERKEYEKQMREKSMKRAEVHLKKITEAVERGALKKQEKIAARASRALGKDKGYRYFGYQVLGDGKFKYFQDENKLEDEKLREGRYILTTNHPKLSAEDAVAKYKELSDLEDIFRTVKDVIDGRPVYHKIDKRICAHLFIAQICLMLIRQLRYHLEKKSVVLSAQDALYAVKSIGIAELNLKGEKHLLVSTPRRDARRVMRALGIKNLQPPGLRTEKME
jgi:transposase